MGEVVRFGLNYSHRWRRINGFMMSSDGRTRKKELLRASSRFLGLGARVPLNEMGRVLEGQGFV